MQFTDPTTGITYDESGNLVTEDGTVVNPNTGIVPPNRRPPAPQQAAADTLFGMPRWLVLLGAAAAGYWFFTRRK